MPLPPAGSPVRLAATFAVLLSACPGESSSTITLSPELTTTATLSPELPTTSASTSTSGGPVTTTSTSGLALSSFVDSAASAGETTGSTAPLGDLPRPNPDNDGIPDELDNCPSEFNPDQADDDGDGIGDVCDCGADDSDGDGVFDDCDNCPDVHNPNQSEIGCLHGDWDDDGLGNECDVCPNSTNDAFGGNCCDPRSTLCVDHCPANTTGSRCYPTADGLLFQCKVGLIDNFLNCGTMHVCAPTGATDKCQGMEPCAIHWCTVGAGPCTGPDVCVPWYLPGEAAPELADLGVCLLADVGPCAGKVGRECLIY